MVARIKGAAMPPVDIRRTFVSVIITLFALLVVGIADISQEAPVSAPIIAQGPEPEVYLKGDVRCKLTCYALGTPTPNISWYKDGRLVASDCPLAETNSAEGRYHCRAENQYGVAISNGSMVQKAVFMVENERRKHKIEDFEPPIVLRCDHVISVPPATITWETTQCHCRDGDTGGVAGSNGFGIGDDDFDCKDCVITDYEPPCRPCKGEKVSFNDSISQLKNGNLLLFGLPPGDRVFRCRAYNHILKQAKWGSYARVIVTETPERHKKNYFSDNPTTVLEGESASLRCVFAGSTSAQVVWMKKTAGMDDFQNVNETNAIQLKNHGLVLFLASSTTSDDGTYRCRTDGSTTTHTIELRVHRKPFLREKVESQTIEEGKTATFSCRGRGRPSPEITWLYNADPLEEQWNNSFSLDETGRELTLEGVTLSDTGVLLCNITNEYGSRLYSASLTVIPRKEVPTTTSPPTTSTTEMTTDRVTTTKSGTGSTNVRREKSNATTTNTTELKQNITDSSRTTPAGRLTVKVDTNRDNNASHLQGQKGDFDRGLTDGGDVTVFILLPILFIIIVIVVLVVAYRIWRRYRVKEYDIGKREATIGLSPMRDKDYDSDDSGIGNDEKDGLKRKGEKKQERDVKTLNCHI